MTVITNSIKFGNMILRHFKTLFLVKKGITLFDFPNLRIYIYHVFINTFFLSINLYAQLFVIVLLHSSPLYLRDTSFYVSFKSIPVPNSNSCF